MNEPTWGARSAPEIDRIVTVSTAHVPKEVEESGGWNLLTDQGYHTALQQASTSDAAYQGLYGHVLHVPGSTGKTHAALSPLIEWARSHDCDFIRFDCDGDVIPGIPTYERP